LEALSFIEKIIGSTARIGAMAFLCMLGLMILRRWNVEPLVSIDEPTYRIVFIAGIAGFCAVVVEWIIAIGGAIKEFITYVAIPRLSEKIERGRHHKAALKNLETQKNQQTLQPNIIATLRYLRAHKLKRFQAPAPETSKLLQRMLQSFLIEIDDPNYERFENAIYNVPNCVWRWIARVEPDYQTIPIPENEPWLPKRPSRQIVDDMLKAGER
jgi:hypothetical protein